MARLIHSGHVPYTLKTFQPKDASLYTETATLENSFSPCSYRNPQGFFFPASVPENVLTQLDCNVAYLEEVDLIYHRIRAEGGMPRDAERYHYGMRLIRQLVFPQIMYADQLYTASSTQYRLLKGFATYFNDPLGLDAKSLFFQAFTHPTQAPCPKIVLFNPIQDFEEYLHGLVTNQIPMPDLFFLLKTMFGSTA